MAKQMVYFNATKQIETITIHYNEKLDGTFVVDVANSIKDIAKKMSKVDLKNPREFETIKVFVYPSKQLFYKVFGGEIEKRFYARRRSTEDLYVVQDAEGNIHIVSPRGMAQEKREEFKKILVMKVLGEYMDENEKQSALRLLKASMKPKEVEQDKQEEIDEQEEEIEEELEEIEEPEEPEEDEQELDEEELEEIIETELVLEQIDEEQEKERNQKEQEKEEKKVEKRSEAQEWLNVGWLAYINGKLKKQEDIQRFAANISANGIKKLGQLSNTKLLESYNFSKEYACAWVEYIVTTYGMKKFAEYYANPKDIKGVFGVSKYVFEAQLKAYIKEKYVGDNKVLNVTEDINLKDIIDEAPQEREKTEEVSEITVLHFSSSGGVDIVSDKEVEQPEIKERV